MQPDGATVRLLRAAQGLSVDQLASAARLTVHALERVEAGAGDLSEQAIKVLARTLGVTVSEIITTGSTADTTTATDAESAPPTRDDRPSLPDDFDQGEPRGVFDVAMDAAFDLTRHTASDRAAVTEALSHSRAPRVSPRELPAAARAWLDTAAWLRSECVSITPVVLARAVDADARNPVAVTMAREIIKADASGQGDDEMSQLTPRVNDGDVQPRSGKSSTKAKSSGALAR